MHKIIIIRDTFIIRNRVFILIFKFIRGFLTYTILLFLVLKLLAFLLFTMATLIWQMDLRRPFPRSLELPEALIGDGQYLGDCWNTFSLLALDERTIWSGLILFLGRGVRRQREQKLSP